MILLRLGRAALECAGSFAGRGPPSEIGLLFVLKSHGNDEPAQIIVGAPMAAAARRREALGRRPGSGSRRWALRWRTALVVKSTRLRRTGSLHRLVRTRARVKAKQ